MQTEGAVEQARRTVDGRTLMVLVRWGMMLLDDTEDNPYSLTADERKEIQSAIDNVKYAMEKVHFAVQDADA